ncbi:ATP-binding cassette sub-family D member 1 [Condylostylus longicornis]|uniref:ATP-binding cassette sub-family D member 1 n=1 Tax=Condylostylus longicornis TaxID=2530218 RepID=UPI00244DFDDB|nr:ATP-binding cassette sub-family D member 1 [Condylostylus longicornis]XP_055383946.1 ATP-binding cassette sub-family D member 1 [Condylostylus longicornis]
MTVLSKVVDDSIRKYEQYGGTKTSFSKALVGVAVFAYTLKLSYPLFKRHIINNKKLNNNNNNSFYNNNNSDYDYCDENINNNLKKSKNNDKKLRKSNKKKRRIKFFHENEEILNLDYDKDDDVDDDDDDDHEDDDDNSLNEVNCNNEDEDDYDDDDDNINNINENLNEHNINNDFLNNKLNKKLYNKNKNYQNNKKVNNHHQKQQEDVQLKIAEAEKLLAKQQQKQNINNNHQLGFNKEFLLQLKKLIYIMIPRPLCYETSLLGVHTLCLISRTFLSIYVASLEGAIVKFIVRRDIKMFAMSLLKWFGIAIPATFINSMIRYLENKLALAFRTRLVKHSYRLYFKSQNYYRVSNLDGRIENADHRLTEDISVFSSSIAHLYSHLTKPCFDLMLIGLALMRSSQKMKSNVFTAPLIGFVVISTTAHILRIVSPKFGQLVSEEANRYGYLRHIHSRIITNAEEIAFYGGHKVELIQLREAYNRLVVQMNTIFTQKLWFVMLEQFFMKYVWSGTGMIMVSLPILTAKSKFNSKEELNEISIGDSSVSERTQYLTTARNLLISAADAIERLMSSYKEIVSLAGYTHRVAGMLSVFEETSKGIYQKPACESAQLANNVNSSTSLNEYNKFENNIGVIEFENGRPIAKGKVVYSSSLSSSSILSSTSKISIDDKKELLAIELKSVPVVTPNCDIVVSSLSLRIEPGIHVLITGPNGCGKSSLFRILSGLWPIYGGELYIPKPIDGKPCMFYIPQRPYMSIGSLCDQIIYPDTRDDMLKKNITENELKEILKLVSLEHIALRDSFDVIRDWKDILSGGEKQRMAIARLFYHRPNYALLDECTSAVSIDVESSIYETAKSMGITLLTITHRPTLWKFHTHILEFDGQGGWNFREMTNDEKLNGSAMHQQHNMHQSNVLNQSTQQQCYDQKS